MVKQMQVWEEFFANYLTKQVCAAVNLLVRITQWTSDAFIGTTYTNRLSIYTGITKVIKLSLARIKSPKQLLPVTLRKSVLYTLIGY